MKKLQDERVYLDTSELPQDITVNLKEAYQCYINGLQMACYIMILRTIEIIINLVYEQHNQLQIDKNGKPIFVSVTVKLNWVKYNKMIGGADYILAKAFIEARNESIHEIFVPSDKQLFSAFETVNSLIKKLKTNL